MPVVFKARVLLELGAELISSDAVALYELIKNSLDANSGRVTLTVQMVSQPSARRALVKKWSAASVKWDVDTFRAEVVEHLEPSANQASKSAFLSLIDFSSASASLASLEKAAFELNQISVSDKGDGMDDEALIRCYLTIGTPERLLEKSKLIEEGQDEGKRIPLGEKGIGRLAAMRIGRHVTVTSSIEAKPLQYQLVLDWRPIFNNPSLGLEALDFAPVEDGQKKEPKGTSIVIRDIQSDWNLEKLRELAEFDLGKLADPFRSDYANQFLKIKYQGGDQSLILAFHAANLDFADATCEISFRAGTIGKSTPEDAQPRLRVTTSYKRFDKAESMLHEGAHLAEIVSHKPGRRGVKPKASDRLPRSDEVVDALASLGDFDAKFWWFNRGRLMREQKELWAEKLRRFVREWSGGLLVYRDGYRVYPYGAAADDWLDLDRKALASSAYKLNRAQIVGCLRISSKKNPHLLDQTNREGFRDCPEKEALRRLLRQAIIADCKTFLERTDKANKTADEETIQDIDNRIGDSSDTAVKNLLSLERRVPAEAATIRSVLVELAEVQDAWNRAKEALKARDDEVEKYSHLAGVGLMVELLAHELARSTDGALELLADKKTSRDPKRLEALEAILKTLNKRVRVIDELSIPGRQRKSHQDVGALAGLIFEFYETKLARHEIQYSIVNLSKSSFSAYVEKGQILQIFDNLMSNSVYWLARRLDRTTAPYIKITLDGKAKKIRFEDNGPGIPTDVGIRVFDAFFTSKQDGGRGLGLYISQRMASENNIKLKLIPAEGGVHKGFELDFGEE
jgi:signal transduction histidine kinase